MPGQVGGTADLVHHGVNGLLVSPRDPAALAAAISQILADPVAAARMSAAARRTAAAYAWPDLACQVLEVYRHVTGPGRSRRTAGARLPGHTRCAHLKRPLP